MLLRRMYWYQVCWEYSPFQVVQEVVCQRRVTSREWHTISKLNYAPASQTKWKLTHMASKVAECLLLSSGMHTKKLERYREGVFSSSQLFYCIIMT